MKREQTTPRILVLNPYDGKHYDVTPLFEYLKKEKTTFKELSIDCLQAGDTIPQIINPDHTAHLRNVQNSLHLLAGLRDTFKAIKHIPNKTG